MKKLVLSTLALVMGATFAHSQGLISIQAGTKNSAELFTNGAPVAGLVSGASYMFELLDMTSAAYTGLTGSQQAQAANLAANPTAVSLWTDSLVSGTAGAGLSVGEVNGLGGALGTTAANWVAPSSPAYTSGGLDYYVIVGWSSTLGSSWSQVSAEAALTGGRQG
jgi:hypothetical protein